MTGLNSPFGRQAGTANASPRQDSSELASPLPSISLPKGGGAIRGIGEKFAANPVTGTGSLSVPIYTSPGRGGFSPQLSLSYDSGASNGSFGLGWSLGLPSLTRKTDRGLPQYADAEESDTFILSGAEDLVPLLVLNDGKWTRSVSPRTVFGTQYEVHSYRPRVEGLFARVERWVNLSDRTDTFWRSISRDNITSWYGKTRESRIMDPTDPGHVFTWLISETHDDKGNVMLYQYKAEDSAGVDLTQAHERNRFDLSRSANRYLKRVFYGNRTPYFADLKAKGPAPFPNDWCFELVFDYGEHDEDVPVPDEIGTWNCRADAFSSYRSTFEVRTYRLCRRALMFHHFPDDPTVGLNCLVRSTDLTHSILPNTDPIEPFYSKLLSVQQTAYQRNGGGYLSSTLPPLQFEYTDAVIDETVRDLDPESIGNLPSGLDGRSHRWVDLDGDGLPGILTEQAGNWYYKPNLSPVNQHTDGDVTFTQAQFGPELAASPQPSLAALASGRQQLLDLSGSGHLDLVEFDGPAAGFFKRTNHGSWEPFQPFRCLPMLDWGDPNLKFIDLTGDGHADLLISEDDAFWWHDSLATAGFGAGQRVAQASDEEKGPKLLLADVQETIFLADFSGDGLTDLVRIRSGEVCYWPNLGYGRFGAKVTMDGAPWFDTQDLFDGRRIQLADIDGSGTSDIIYFANGSVHLYFNQSGNAWTKARKLQHFPRVESASPAVAVDLLGNGTACLLWSSPLPGNAVQPMRYIDLMGGQKPHLLVHSINNLGAETHVQYAPSTKFYVADKLAGKPWLTRIPFPVHVVERVETYDYIGRNRFVTRYAYHHGYYDGVEREFRGFGRVDQWDTEEFATLTDSAVFPPAANLDPASNVPPVLTKTWFHTGVYFGEERISKHLEDEYYSEGDSSDGVASVTPAQLEAMLLPDTVLPTTVLLADSTRVAYDMTSEEAREACRALRGSILRQEIYGFDGTDASDRPYTVSERDYTLEIYQPQGPNKYAVFLAHSRESIDFHYERKIYNVAGNALAATGVSGSKVAADPRVSHAFTLNVDNYGNVLQSAAVAYGRRYLDPDLTPADQPKQSHIQVSYNDASFTNAVLGDDVYRAPLPSQTSAYELLQVQPDAAQPGVTNLFRCDEIVQKIQAAGDGAHYIAFENLNPAGLNPGQPYRRLLKSERIMYRPDDMGQSAGDPKALLPLRRLESLALPGCHYAMALTRGLISQVYQRGATVLLPDPVGVLGRTGPDGGGYADLDGDGNWWVPSGRAFFSSNGADDSATEFTNAHSHFFLPRRVEDPFGHLASVDYDVANDVLPISAIDALGNKITSVNDYRTLQPSLVTDPNGNRVAISFDVLGMVAGTAVMGKTSEHLGDSFADFTADLTQQQIDDFYSADDPHSLAGSLLGTATTRIVYDVNRFFATRTAAPDHPTQWKPAFAAAIARETHVSDLQVGQQSKKQITFSYSDGFSREIQKKVQAEPVPGSTTPRWVGSGWTILNNKGKPVRQYESFFSGLSGKGHQFEFGVQVGVSSILCYDPLERVVATVHPNHTYDKVVFDPWRQQTWDVNDTVLGNPAVDPDVGNLIARMPLDDYSPTWYAHRNGGPDPLEQDAANKAAAHANTPATAYFDSLGRPFLTIADNGTAGKYATRIEFDIEGNQRSVTDALGRKVMVYDYDVLGKPIHHSSMEAGERWMLNSVADKPIRGWDTRGHNFRTAYDELQRPISSFMSGTDPNNSDPRTLSAEILYEKTVYGENQQNDIVLNLRTRVFQHFDSAGVSTSLGHNPETKLDEAYDFKGNLLRGRRQLVQDYKSLPNWSSAPPLLQPHPFTRSTRYDALNRAVAATTPDGSVYTPTYNEANLLETVAVNLQGALSATPFVNNIDYDAKGQRLQIDYGNGASTTYEYDPNTFRLTRLATTRLGFPTDERAVQDLKYTYDPVGNITHIQDDAQDAIFFSNQRVEPSNDYTYDAIYRLIQATGREHLGQNGAGALMAPVPTSYNDVPRVNLLHPNDGNAMGTYQEQYEYDGVGNFLQYVHKGSNPANPGWTRSYTYSEVSLLEPGKVSNRLSRTTISGAQPYIEAYTYDVHGNMTSMPQLQAVQWDFKDQLQVARRQAVNSDDADGVQHQGERTYYVYDSAGQRVRKATERENGTLMKERIYLGGCEIYREYDGSGSTITLERQSLHVMDDKQRIALVETRTQGSDGTAAQLIRYQFSNHLGSASLELDDRSRIISYEEYYPYGSTSYQAVSSQTQTPKRYRYTGMERDEETGLNYHGVRYYSPWLNVWISTDPAGIQDDPNMYGFTHNNPVLFKDISGTDSTSILDDMLLIVKERHEFGLQRQKLLHDPYMTFFVRLGEQAMADCSNKTTEEQAFDIGVAVFAKKSGYQARFVEAAWRGDVAREKRDDAQQGAYEEFTGGYLQIVVQSKKEHRAFVEEIDRSANATLVFAELSVISSMGGGVHAEGAGDASVEPGSYAHGAPLEPTSMQAEPQEPMRSPSPIDPVAAPSPKPVDPTGASAPSRPSYTPNPRIQLHGEQPSPRPPRTQSHHSEQQTALSRNIVDYDPDSDPTLLMSTPQHYLTYGPQTAQRSRGADFIGTLGSAHSLGEAAAIMVQAGEAAATAGQIVLEHASYLFGLTPLNQVQRRLP